MNNLALGQRWTFKDRTWEIEELRSGRVRLRRIFEDSRAGESRTLDADTMRKRYSYIGEFSLPKGYMVGRIVHGPGGHCYKTPAGNVHGAQPGVTWTWKQARDAAVEHSAGG